jgi:hypothetical protein
MSSDSVMLHVRFAPDAYQGLSGGRGVFRITRDKLQELRAGIAANNAAA